MIVLLPNFQIEREAIRQSALCDIRPSLQNSNYFWLFKTFVDLDPPSFRPVVLDIHPSRKRYR